MAKRILGTGTTDANGCVVLADGYTGTGAGLVDIVAEAVIDESSVVSQPSSVIDGVFANYYDGYIMGSANITKSQDGDAVLFTSNGTAQGVYLRKQGESGNYNYPTPCCLEFDIVSFESTSDIGIQFYDGTTNITNTFNTLGITGAGHIKCEYKSDKAYFTVDGVSKDPINKVCSGNARILFTNITASLKIRNVVVYPI